MAEPAGRHWTTHVGQAAGHPAAFLVVIAYAVLWLTFSGATFDWNAVATLAVFGMRSAQDRFLIEHGHEDGYGNTGPIGLETSVFRERYQRCDLSGLQMSR
jgi:hypothetical protein